MMVIPFREPDGIIYIIEHQPSFIEDMMTFLDFQIVVGDCSSRKEILTEWYSLRWTLKPVFVCGHSHRLWIIKNKILHAILKYVLQSDQVGAFIHLGQAVCLVNLYGVEATITDSVADRTTFLSTDTMGSSFALLQVARWYLRSGNSILSPQMCCLIIPCIAHYKLVRRNRPSA